MRDLGDGKYVSVSLVKGMSILNNKDVFDFAEVSNQEAQREEKLDYEDFFMTDIMFDDFKLIESTHEQIDLLRVHWITSYDDTEDLERFFRNSKEDDRKNDRNFKELEDQSYIGTAYEDVSKYTMKFKISSKLMDRIAFMTVMKIPGEGYRVTSFFVL